MRRGGVGVAVVSLIAAASPLAAQTTLGGFRKLMAECEGVSDPARRLACFEQAARQLRYMDDSAFAGAAGAAPSGRKNRALFGLRGTQRADEIKRQNPAAPPETKEVDAAVLARAESTPGSWLVVLQDAGTWKTETNTDFMPPKVGETVKVRQSSFGGYLLEVGKQPSIRVSRLN